MCDKTMDLQGQFHGPTHVNMGFMWVPYGYFERQHAWPHVENSCILQCAPLVASTLAQHGQYIWQTHMGFMWVPCGSFDMRNTWVPRGKLLHTPVCPWEAHVHVGHSWGPWNFVIWGLASWCDIFNRLEKDPMWRRKVFHLSKRADSSWNLIPLAVLRIWYHNGYPVLLDINLAYNPTISRLPISVCTSSYKQSHKSLCQKGWKGIDTIINFEAIMMIWAILRNFTILGVGGRIMDINQNVYPLECEYILHSV